MNVNQINLIILGALIVLWIVLYWFHKNMITGFPKTCVKHAFILIGCIIPIWILFMIQVYNNGLAKIL